METKFSCELETDFMNDIITQPYDFWGCLAWKVSVFGVILVRIFPAFGPNTEQCCLVLLGVRKVFIYEKRMWEDLFCKTSFFMLSFGMFIGLFTNDNTLLID